MKLFLIASALLSGSGAVAMQNETVNEAVTEQASRLRVVIQKRLQQKLFETVKESGFPYPSEEYLATLTEDQAFAITSAIDVINATYDWQSMTDEEIIDALHIVKDELNVLYEELGLEPPVSQIRERIRNRIRNNRQNTTDSEENEQLNQTSA